MEVNNATAAELTGGRNTGATGGIQLAEEAVLFESLMENIGLAPPSSTITQATTSSNVASTSSISVGPPSASDGPHPISTETITLHYPIDSSLNPSTLFADNDLDESIREEHLICPHRAVEVLSPVKLNEQAKDQVIEYLYCFWYKASANGKAHRISSRKESVLEKNEIVCRSSSISIIELKWNT